MASDLPKHAMTAAASAMAYQDGDQPTSGLFPPFIINKPNSVHADKVGRREGQLITDNAESATRLKSKLAEIEEFFENEGISDPPEIVITHFKNWADTQESLLLHAKPGSVEDVQNLVQAAGACDVKVGMGGAYHSWSPMFPDAEGLLLNMCDLKLQKSETSDGKSRIDFDEVNMTVTIVPGVTTGELMHFFLNNDICFESDVLLANVTYGGVFCGGCHGTGQDQESMSDWIVSLKVVDGEGTVQTLPPETLPDGATVSLDQVLKAAQVNLGVLGVVIEFTVEVKRMSKRRVKNMFDRTLGDLFGSPDDPVETSKLAELLHEYWSVEIFWFPFNSLLDFLMSMLPTRSNPNINIPLSTPPEVDPQVAVQATPTGIFGNLWNPLKDKLWIRGINDAGASPISLEPGVPLWSKMVDILVHTTGDKLLSPLIATVPCATPFLILPGFQVVKLQYGLQAEEVVRTPWAIHFRDAIGLMPVYDIEFCFPIDITNPTLAVQAVHKVIEITHSYAKHGKYPRDDTGKAGNKYPLTLCMEMRVMKKSTALLCPASIGAEEHMAYIEVLSTSGTVGYEEYFADLAKAWMEQGIGGIPHWNKQWTFLKDAGVPNIFHYLRQKYGDNLTTFKRVREELGLDQNNIFMNKTMAELFADSTSASGK